MDTATPTQTFTPTPTQPVSIASSSPPTEKEHRRRHRHPSSSSRKSPTPSSAGSTSSSSYPPGTRISPHDAAKGKTKPVIYGPMKVSDINSPGPKEGPFANMRLPSSTCPWRSSTSEGIVHADKFKRWTDGPMLSSGCLSGNMENKPNGKPAPIKSINGIPVKSKDPSPSTFSKVKPNHTLIDA